MLFICFFFIFFARVLAYTMIMGKTANVRIGEKAVIGEVGKSMFVG